MSDFFGFQGNYREINTDELRNMAAQTLGIGEPRINAHREEEIFLCAVNHGKHDSVIIYRDPLERYTVILYGFISSYDLLEAELRRTGVNPENKLMALILQAYKVLTRDFVDLLRGNFSLLIADSLTNNIYLAKDHFGSYPLYYSGPMHNGVRFFGTNIPAMAKHPDFVREFNPEPLAYYLSLEYNPLHESFWRNVYSLRPGHWALLTENNVWEQAYFTPSFVADERSLAEHVEEIYESVDSSIKNYVNDDVLGAYLSGGVDSAFITVLAQPEHVFSLGYDGFTAGIYNESEQASSLAKKHGLNFHSAIVDGEEYISAILRTQKNLNQANGNLSTVALCLLNNHVKESVSYVLTGDGADEFFGGYDTYLAPTKRKLLYERILPRSLRSFVAGRIKSDVPFFSRLGSLKRSGMDISEYYFGTNLIVQPDLIDQLLKPELLPQKTIAEIFEPFYNKYAGKDELTLKMLLDLNYLMPGNMSIKAERMANAHNIQLRTPLLNRSVFDAARTIPSQMRVSDRESKIPFRQAAARVLEDDWVHHKKLGFPVPFRYYLKNQTIAQPLYDILQDPFIELFFQRETVNRYLKEHLEEKRNRHRELYVILAFILWYKANFRD